ncbi:MAG: hypothetical protein AAF224_08735 [Pseudomonadota bacterium]
MIRSLAAVLVAVIAGLTCAKFLEGGLAAMVDVAPSSSLPPQEFATEGASTEAFADQAFAGDAGASGIDDNRPARPVIGDTLALILAVSWTFAAFAAAMLTLLLARRWAPLAWLAGATIAFNGLIVMVGAATPWFLWPLALGGPIVAAYGAIRALNAGYQLPSAKKPDFDF